MASTDMITGTATQSLSATVPTQADNPAETKLEQGGAHAHIVGGSEILSIPGPARGFLLLRPRTELNNQSAAPTNKPELQPMVQARLVTPGKIHLLTARPTEGSGLAAFQQYMKTRADAWNNRIEAPSATQWAMKGIEVKKALDRDPSRVEIAKNVFVVGESKALSQSSAQFIKKLFSTYPDLQQRLLRAAQREPIYILVADKISNAYSPGKTGVAYNLYVPVAAANTNRGHAASINLAVFSRDSVRTPIAIENELSEIVTMIALGRSNNVTEQTWSAAVSDLFSSAFAGSRPRSASETVDALSRLFNNYVGDYKERYARLEPNSTYEPNSDRGPQVAQRLNERLDDLGLRRFRDGSVTFTYNAQAQRLELGVKR